MTQYDKSEYTSITPALDELSSTLMGNALDRLAEGEPMGVLVVTQDRRGETSSLEFLDDDAASLLEAARMHVRRARQAQRYAIAYVGAVETDDGTYADALLLEFGERARASFSAYSLFEGRGTGEDFAWTEPAAAGEEEPLLG